MNYASCTMIPMYSTRIQSILLPSLNPQPPSPHHAIASTVYSTNNPHRNVFSDKSTRTIYLFSQRLLNRSVTRSHSKPKCPLILHFSPKLLAARSSGARGDQQLQESATDDNNRSKHNAPPPSPHQDPRNKVTGALMDTEIEKRYC